MAGIKVEGLTGTVVEVAGANQLKVIPETNVAANPGNVGAVRTFGENDQGLVTGVVDLASTEIDLDYRARSALDIILFEDAMSYTAQNTGVYSLTSTTMTGTFTAGQFTTNGSSITTTTTGVVLATYATFNQIGTQTLSFDVETAFSAQPTTNTFVEFGIGAEGTATTAPTDGVFFRLDSAGLKGVISFNGTETIVAFPLSNGTGTWAYTNNKRYQFIGYLGGVEAEFWVNDGTGAVKLGRIPLPTAQGRLTLSNSGKFFYKHRITGGAAGGVMQSLLGAINIRSGGGNIAATPLDIGHRAFGAYRGLSGGTMGRTATYPNSTAPVSAIPANTSLTANLPSGWGGQGLIPAQAAAATDFLVWDYTNPVGTVNAPGRMMGLSGISVDAVNLGAAVATTATTIQLALEFGHTAASLATVDTATAKGPAVIPLGFMTWPVGAAIGAQPQFGPIRLPFPTIYLAPGDHVALAMRFVLGTATGSQTIQFTVTPVGGPVA